LNGTVGTGLEEDSQRLTQFKLSVGGLSVDTMVNTKRILKVSAMKNTLSVDRPYCNGLIPARTKCPEKSNLVLWIKLLTLNPPSFKGF
jgi:hypothetical protein